MAYKDWVQVNDQLTGPFYWRLLHNRKLWVWRKEAKVWCWGIEHHTNGRQLPAWQHEATKHAAMAAAEKWGETHGTKLRETMPQYRRWYLGEKKEFLLNSGDDQQDDPFFRCRH